MTLGQRLRDGEVLHLAATVTHARRGPIRHAFRHGADYLLLAPDHARPRPFFSLDRFNLLSLYRRDHGGPRGKGEGVLWARRQFEEAGLAPDPGCTVALMTQPRLLGYWFTPVSFWLVLRGDTLVAVIAEVNNTFGQRHSYLCRHEGFAPILPGDSLAADKVFHVSPFQQVEGGYRFGFALGPDRVAVRITHLRGAEGLDAAMAGALAPLTATRALGACLRRPGGSLRVLALIYWHALRLRLKGARYRSPPAPPEQEIT